MSITFHIESCIGLISRDFSFLGGGKSDPFVVVSSSEGGAEIFQTPVVSQTINPTWSAGEGTFVVALGVALSFDVWDLDTIGKDFLGRVDINTALLDCTVSDGVSVDIGLQLKQRADEKDKEVIDARGRLGVLRLRYTYSGRSTAIVFPRVFHFYIEGCTGLIDRDAFGSGSSDPFVVVNNNVFVTPIMDDTTNPEWTAAEGSFNMFLESPEPIVFSVWDKDTVGQDFLGQVVIDPSVCLERSPSVVMSLQQRSGEIEPEVMRHKGRLGTIRLSWDSTPGGTSIKEDTVTTTIPLGDITDIETTLEDGSWDYDGLPLLTLRVTTEAHDVMLFAGQYHTSLVASPHAGAVALIRPDFQTVSLRSADGSDVCPDVVCPNPIRALGWGDHEILCIVCENGDVYTAWPLVLAASGVFTPPFSQVRVFRNGVVAIEESTNTLRVWTSDKGLVASSPLGALIVTARIVATTNPLEFFLGTDTGALHIATVDPIASVSFANYSFGSGKLTHVTVSPDGLSLAVFCAKSQTLHVAATDMSARRCSLRIMHSLPRKVEWCGNDVVIVFSAEGEEHQQPPLAVDCSNGDHTFLSAHTDLFSNFMGTVSECDGLRMYTPTRSLFWVPISKASLRTVSLLVDAYRTGVELGDMDAAHVTLSVIARGLEGHRGLGKAFRMCMTSAARETSVPRQQAYLRVANLCRCYSDSSQSVEELMQTFRVLRAMRGLRAVGIPISMRQLQALGASCMVDRLMGRGRFRLAFRVAERLRVGVARVVQGWGKDAISRKMTISEEKVFLEVLDAYIARGVVVSCASLLEGHTKAASPTLMASLAERERNPARRVMTLLAIGTRNDIMALSAAIESGDMDLVVTVLVHLQSTLPLGEFHKEVHRYPAASVMYTKRMIDPSDTPALSAFYTSVGDSASLDVMDLHAIMADKMPRKGAKKGSWVEKQSDLLCEQYAISDETRDFSILGTSLVHTVRYCLSKETEHFAKLAKRLSSDHPGMAKKT